MGLGGVRVGIVVIPFTNGSGTWSSSARKRVNGAMAMRFWSFALPSVTGSKSLDEAGILVGW